MNKNLTDITIVLDRSGSMQSCRTDAQGGVNSFIEDQAKQSGEALLTLVQFDNEYEFVHKGVPIKDVPPFTLVPRGSTALYDAIGRAINETGERLAKIPEQDRPGLVLFAIVTDGEENDSKEFTQEQIKKMIDHQTTKYNWKFTYVGANQDAFKVANSINIPTSSALNYSTACTKSAFSSLSSGVIRARSMSARGASAELSYTKNEIKSSIGK
jgi:uncharacterized protein YegL